jgi:hypothetical protein
MKAILSSRRDHYLAKFSIFLIAVALIAGMVGCVPYEYDLTIASTAGGEVIKPGEGTFTCYEGTVVVLIATEDEGYRFVEWIGDVRDIAHVKDSSTTITVTGNHSITATFEEIPEYNLTISSTTGGNVTAPGEGTFTRDGGTVVTLEAHEDVSYGFVGWTGDVETIAGVNRYSTSITMQGDYSITANFEKEDPVTFADTNLEAAIKEAINIHGRPIYPSDLKRLLTRLDTKKVGNVSDLTGLEHCTGLTRLILYNKQIDDISPLVKLASLTELNIERNQTSDISPLAKLTSLRELSLGGNQISDISPVANLISLKYLSLGGNQISDISPLANLTSLRKLFLGGNQISDISPVANLTSLTNLSLELNQISDISPLAKLTSLTDLSLGGNQISDISPLAKLTSLTDLSLGGNQISDISPLAKLTKLKDLSLEHNQISDISPLAKLTKLKDLDLSDNQISDIEPLVNNPGLSRGDEVDLWNNPLSDNSINIYIPQLQARDVIVQYEPRP